MKLRRPAAQLSLQVPPFEKQLAARLDQPSGKGQRGDLTEIKRVTTPGRFLGKQNEISRDDAKRIRLRPETLELRMARIASGLAAQNLLRQQPFPPRGHQPFSIEIARMNSPEAHP